MAKQQIGQLTVELEYLKKDSDALVFRKYLEHPFFGSRRITDYLQSLELSVNRKHVQRLLNAEVAISIDGRSRCHDTIFIERLWRSPKYEDIHIKEYTDIWQLHNGITKYFDLYYTNPPHQALGYLTPSQVYYDSI